MRFLVLGAGAVGGYFGGRLAEAGADVTFLVRPRRQAQLREHGLQIQSPLGSAQVAVPAVLADEVAADYDVILLSCKAYDLDAAMDAIAPAMQGGCAVVPLLNGLAHLERLNARFGREQVMPGTCMIDAEMLVDGTISHGGGLQRITFGEYDGSHTPRAEALAQVFARSTIDSKLDAHIVQRLWDKLVFLSALAAGCCLFRANVREIIAAPGGRDAMERLLAGNLAVARAEGHAVAAADAQRALARLTDPEGTWSASLLRDLEAGGRIEGDHIVGWMLDRARQHGVDDTTLSLAFTALKAYEVRRDTRAS